MPDKSMTYAGTALAQVLLAEENRRKGARL